MWLKRVVSTCLIGAQLAVCVPAFADPPTDTTTSGVVVVDKNDSVPAVTPMKKGQTAPYTGVLLSPRGLATIVATVDTANEKTKIEVDKATGQAQAQCTFKVSEAQAKNEADQKILQAQLTEKLAEIDMLTNLVKKEQASRPNTTLWTGVGFGGGVLVTVLTVFAVSKASK